MIIPIRMFYLVKCPVAAQEGPVNHVQGIAWVVDKQHLPVHIHSTLRFKKAWDMASSVVMCFQLTAQRSIRCLHVKVLCPRPCFCYIRTGIPADAGSIAEVIYRLPDRAKEHTAQFDVAVKVTLIADLDMPILSSYWFIEKKHCAGAVTFYRFPL